MSEENNIQDRIKIIFDKESHEWFKRFDYHYQPETELNPSYNWRLKWDTYNALKKLYNIVEKDIKSREIFDDTIKGELLKESCASSLAFYFLLKIGKNKEIIEIIEKRQNNIPLMEYTSCKKALFEDIQRIMH